MGWTYLDGVNEPQTFLSHGYCGGSNSRWFRTYDESKRIQGNEKGTLHPNLVGHQVYKSLLYQRLVQDLAASP